MPRMFFRIPLRSWNSRLKFFSFARSHISRVLLLCFALSLIGAHSLRAYTFSDTGQIKCYDDAHRIWCPQPGEPFYGQDAEYDGPGQAYQDNGDGTVTDFNTGLVWQQEGHKYTGDEGIPDYQQESVDYCAALFLGGRSDWRLPGLHELVTIMDYGMSGPALNTQYFTDYDSSYPHHYYESADWKYATPGTRWAYFVDFADGRTFAFPARVSPYTARCVSGNPLPCPSYTDNYDGTVIDSETGLMWQQSDDGVSRNWGDALAYCEGLSMAGFDDWRLPNVTELERVSRCQKNGEPIAWHWKSTYWSSTTSVVGSDQALAYDYWEQFGVNAFNQLKSLTGYTRCVRGGGVFPAPIPETPVPTPIGPTNNADLLKYLTFEWSLVDIAVGYELQVDNDCTFKSPEINAYYAGTTSLDFHGAQMFNA